MDGGYDAAFGPMGTLASTPTSPFTADEVKELQRALNALGYGPLVVDGILGPKTDAAMGAFASATNYVPSSKSTSANRFELRDLIVRAAANRSGQSQGNLPATGGAAAAAAQPFYKNPWVLGTLALAAVAGYIAWRASGKSTGAVSGHDDEPERRERRGRKAKRSLGDEKCGRTPMAGFEDGEPVELEAPEYAEKVED